MVDKFERMIDLNKYYSDDISHWSENTENLNDDVLLKMLQNLLFEYDINSDLLRQELKFKKELYKKNKNIEDKKEKSKLAFEIRKKKFEIRKRNRFNNKLYRLFKKKLKIDLRNEYLKNLKENSEYCDRFSNVKLCKNDLLLENKLKKYSKFSKRIRNIRRIRFESIEKAAIKRRFLIEQRKSKRV